MAEIKYEYKGKTDSIFAKLEYYNYTGSIKDRVEILEYRFLPLELLWDIKLKYLCQIG